MCSAAKCASTNPAENHSLTHSFASGCLERFFLFEKRGFFFLDYKDRWEVSLCCYDYGEWVYSSITSRTIQSKYIDPT